MGARSSTKKNLFIDRYSIIAIIALRHRQRIDEFPA